MKFKLKSSIHLMILIISMLTFIINPIPFVLSETHVEGSITQDTVWTLTDSPFIVIKNLVIEAGATLTIESGVEVRFGGNFSLIVRGKLEAKGNTEKPITFTSNKLQPEKGDWDTISFTSMQPSRLEYCIVKYAENGITIENGNVLITRSEISHSLQNGVYITGNNNAVISENRIENNLNGIFINGSSTGASIQQNNIYFNIENGIYLYGNKTIENTLILNNRLSTNPTGIHIYRQVNASIARNSIAYNELGILHENATNIAPLQYNDIYNNTLAARATSSNPVNEEYNYWGDRSGPYHISLNPLGKGNPIESNGIDLDFIPFLTINNSYLNQRPIAHLLTNKLMVPPNQDVTFIGTLSEDDRQVYRYFFDFGDGKNSGWTTLSIFTHKYDSVGTYSATLMVMDDFGATSINPATLIINVQNLTPLNVHLELSSYTIKSEESVSITVQVTDGVNAVQGANVALISLKGGTFEPVSGLTDSLGRFTSIFTAPSSSQISNVRLIAIASKSGYADGSDHKYLEVLPPLSVQIETEPETIRSEDVVNVTIRVTYNGSSISGAEVTAYFDVNGNLSTKTGTTDENGCATFVFVAPKTFTPLNVAIRATATKSGYIDGEAYIQKTVEPKILVVYIKAEPDFIGSGETSLITVYVLSNGEPVPNATVSLSSNKGGQLDPETGTTGEDGSVTFNFVAFGTLTLRNATIRARATKTGYVTGETQTTIAIEPRTADVHIVQDTVWTLTDSPFVIVRDVFVEANASLTIEPEVEVRFGGNFSLIIRGRLDAKGTEEKPIRFTSNRQQPSSGDWNTIKFVGTETSTLEYCVIEYAINGITVENSSVVIKNSMINNNLNSGVHATKENNASLERNRIAFNQNGISIQEKTSGIEIKQNRIFFNSHYGILIQAPVDASILRILVFNNSLFSNPIGIYVNGWVTANITRNSISQNNIGILYENAINTMPARYNDIYGNVEGVNVLTSAPVYADYNFWGDVSGPYHATLNPLGKGNPVGGNGVDLVFIPFLTTNNSRLNEPPVANLITDKDLVLINQTVTFIATNSVDEGRICWYFFDFGDGKNSGWITQSIFMHKYNSVGSYNTILIVIDDSGAANINTAIVTINVQDGLTLLFVNISLGDYTADYSGQVSLLVHVTDGTNAIESADVTLIAVKGGVLQLLSGYTNATGYFSTSFTYPNVTKITLFRIIATASKSGYADGSDHKYLEAFPPLLVQITIENPIIEPEEATNIIVHATYNSEPIGDAYIQMDFIFDGNHSLMSGYTNDEGLVTFVFTAPQLQAPVPINVTIIATARKSGYVTGEKHAYVTVKPRNLTVTIIANPSEIESEKTSTITVYVTSKEKLVSNVDVSVTAGAGAFSGTTNITNSYGYCTFLFTAPKITSEISVSILASATKLGYISAESQIIISVIPETTIETGGGWPLTTILMIAIPLVIVAIIVILIKLGIIEASYAEEEK